MRLPARRIALPLLLGTLTLVACGGVADLMRFTAGLVQKFGPASVNVTNRHPVVTLQNSPAANAPEPERAAVARQVGEYVRDRFPGYGRLQDVTVVFASHRQYGPVGVTKGEGTYTFTRADLGPPRTATGAPAAGSGVQPGR